MEKSLQTFYTAGQMSHRSGDHRVPNHCHSHSWTVENGNSDCTAYTTDGHSSHAKASSAPGCSSQHMEESDENKSHSNYVQQRLMSTKLFLTRLPQKFSFIQMYKLSTTSYYGKRGQHSKRGKRFFAMLVVSLLFFAVCNISGLPPWRLFSRARNKVRSYFGFYDKQSISRAYLPSPMVFESSPDACADALGIPKIALMFLTTRNLFHENMWRLWFQSVEGLIPSQVSDSFTCQEGLEDMKLDDKIDACTNKNAGLHLDLKTEKIPNLDFRNEDIVSRKMLQKSKVDGSTENKMENAIDSQHLYSVYVHAPPDFDGYSNDSLWAGRIIQKRVETSWGSHTLVEATRNLLWEAYKDPLNTHFVLLSESDIPLYDPLTMWQQLQTEKTSRIDTCGQRETSPWRWDPLMRIPNVMESHHWRKSSQWITLTRAHAKVVLDDIDIYRKFEEHCWSAWDHAKDRWFKECFSDEHYFATLLHAKGLGKEGVCNSRGTSFTDWSIPNSAHPKAFGPEDINSSLIIVARETIPEELKQTEDGAKVCDWKIAHHQASRMFVQKDDLLSFLNARKSQHVLHHPPKDVHAEDIAENGFNVRNEPPGLKASNAINKETTRSLCTASDNEFSRPLSFVESALPPFCFLTARKFPEESIGAVLTLFLECKDSNTNLLRKDVCLAVEKTIPCTSFLSKLTYLMKGTCS